MLWIGQLLSDTGSEIGMLAYPPGLRNAESAAEPEPETTAAATS